VSAQAHATVLYRLVREPGANLARIWVLAPLRAFCARCALLLGASYTRARVAPERGVGERSAVAALGTEDRAKSDVRGSEVCILWIARRGSVS